MVKILDDKHFYKVDGELIGLLYGVASFCENNNFDDAHYFLGKLVQKLHSIELEEIK